MSALLPPPVMADGAIGFLPALATAVGRVHPIIVHFPVALVLAAAGVEAWRAVQKHRALSRFTPVALGLGTAAAVVACITGWLFAADEGGGSDLFWHRWLGILAAALLVPVTWAAVRAVRPGDATGAQLSSLVRTVLLGTALLVGWVGHLGGDMVWGENFVLKPLEQWASGGSGNAAPGAAAPGAAAPGATAPGVAATGTAPPVPGGPRPALAAAVFGIFNARCMECHNDERHKGDLSMQDPEQLFTQNDHGEWIVKRGDPDASLLLHRVLLPADDDEAMPPKGDRLTKDEVKLIRQWIAADAPLPTSSGEAPVPVVPPDPQQSGAQLGAPPPLPAPLPLPAVPPRTPDADRAFEALRAAGVRAQPVAEGAAGLDVSAATLGSAFGDQQLAMLVPLAPYMVELNLARTAVTDAGLSALPAMPVLISLRLDGTAAGDGWAAQLPARAPALRTLNLVGTGATDTTLRQVAGLQGLQRLYVWHTRVTSDGLRALQEARPALFIQTGAPPAAQPAPDAKAP